MSGLPSQYDSIAARFIEGAGVHNDASRRAYYDVLDFPLVGKRVLDIGCGDGYDLARMHERGAVCYGIDSSADLSKQAHLNVPYARITRGIMEALPYKDESFDIVLSKYAFQTSHDVPLTLREATRVLKPGGIITYLTVHPLRQFLEKKRHPKDYFIQEIVESVFFGGSVSAREPTHTLEEYMNGEFLRTYDLLEFREHADFPSSEQIDGDTYPCFFILKARKRVTC